MRYRILIGIGLGLTMAACGSASEEAASYDSAERVTTADIAEEAAEGSAGAAADSAVPEADLKVSEGGETAPPAVSAPKIAYTYDYGYRIASEEIVPLAQKHIDLCESLPNNGCRVVNLQQSGAEGRYGFGNLELSVAAAKARAFGQQLAGASEGMGGEQINVAIAGEDLSKQIVDTEARLRARILLRDRLMEILRSRRGTVAELVEAERGVAQVNEEIDQARSWLTEMRGRVAYSKVSIEYSSGSRASGSFGRPIVEAFQSLGSIMGSTIAALVYAGGIILPLLILLLALRWVLHRFGMRLRFWKDREPATEQTEPNETS